MTKIKEMIFDDNGKEIKIVPHCIVEIEFFSKEVQKRQVFRPYEEKEGFLFTRYEGEEK